MEMLIGGSPFLCLTGRKANRSAVNRIRASQSELRKRRALLEETLTAYGVEMIARMRPKRLSLFSLRERMTQKRERVRACAEVIRPPFRVSSLRRRPPSRAPICCNLFFLQSTVKTRYARILSFFHPCSIHTTWGGTESGRWERRSLIG